MLILLDIDGVMVPWKPSETLNDGFAKFSKRAVRNLQRIISETGASIVLTSSHKSNYGLSEWNNIFNYRGINTSIDKLEDNINNLSRKDEIVNWFYSKFNDSDDFVIIDDDKSLGDLPMYLKEKVVLTNALVGLNEEAASSAIQILKKQNLATVQI
jgi:hypothetical protein